MNLNEVKVATIKSPLVKRINYCIIFTLFFCLSPLAFAWNATGHKLVAQIAYVQLNEEVKQQVDELLNYQFINASVWADQVRAKGNDTMNTWHYINLPTPSPQKNVVDAIIDTQAILKNPGASKKQKQWALRGLIHWVGDIHQPLHTITRDRGGTLFFLTKNPYGKNLHQLWDNGAGALQNVANIKQTAEEWQLAYPPSQSQLMQTDPMEWALAGYLIATLEAYKDISPKKAPSETYIERVQLISKEQIVLAGNRLAQILNKLTQNAP